MKTTKKTIYAKYGIEYKGGKILTPIGWLNELLKVGNSKTGANVRTWSMNQTTCCCRCEGCYADSGFYRTATVKKSLANNTEIATKHLDFFNRCIRAQLETLPDGTEVRIHAVGDFFSLEYVKVWHDIARDFNKDVFWTYTKTEHDEAFDDLENANVVSSMVDGGYNFGHCDYIKKKYNDLKTKGEDVYICRCGIDDSQHCEGCHNCSIHKYVLFIEHSTDYKAELDPMFEELKAIIDNQ